MSASHAKANVGSVCLVRHRYPPGRWKKPAVPEYAPNWVLSLRMPGMRVPLRKSSQHAICAPCLATAGAPTQVRPECRCQKPAREFGQSWLEDERALWTGLRDERMKLPGARRPKAVVMIAEVLEIYSTHGPKDADKQARRVRYLLEQATGLRMEDMTMELLMAPREMILRWAAMRQWYAEKWSMRADPGKEIAPVDAWRQLRARWEALPPRERMPDLHTVRQANTTIRGHVRDLKCVFSRTSRTMYLPGLDLPLTPKLEEIQLRLPGPKGLVMIPDEAYRRMWDDMEKLRAGEPWRKVDPLKLWTALQLAQSLGPRTIELKTARPAWLEGDVLVLKNRPEEGFILKAQAQAPERHVRLSAEVVEAIRRIQTPESLLGLSPGEREQFFRRGSEWIRQYIPTGKHTWYWFRKLAGSLRYQSEDMEAAGRFLGHAPGSKVTADTYVRPLHQVVESISAAELHPDRLRLGSAG